ncbi:MULTISPECIES: DNA topoisomerase III [Exiguobacterium]|uniref:DNA topoisomerase III n=1 Tax=Exiguobacterium TaxID=33986 RepID=UPI001BE988EB|nr:MULTISPECIES: DNA topoisomerase III [Exiguobacterium]MCT4776571.1 DNA topoisomerase III [Exiguobacterium aquaticum]MCT4788760.1 DNA topoisomerase III [Exiguobacterium mexicanum]
MRLIIAEKPSQAQKLAAPYPSKKKKDEIEISSCARFPEGAIVVWAVGHLCELQEPSHYKPEWKSWKYESLPIVPDRFDYRISKGKSKPFQTIKKWLHDRSITDVIIASDAEREGEAIVRLILRLAGNQKPLSRLWISSLTEQAVDRGFAALLPGDQTVPYYHEAMSRACADWLVGMNASRAYTTLLKTIGIEDVFSLGRVQTPTLALIVNREREIKQFVPEPYFEVEATLQKGRGTFKAKYTLGKTTKLKTREQADAVVDRASGTAVVHSIDKEDKTEHPPFWFSLSGLQAEAGKRFGFGAKKTLDIAQKLYTKGWISYPRTDSSFVTPDEATLFPQTKARLLKSAAYAGLKDVLTENPSRNSRYVNAKKVSDHYAIIPTEACGDVARLSGDEAKLYDLINRRFLAAFAPPAKLEKTTVDLMDGDDLYRAKGTVVVSPGYRQVVEMKSKDVELPALTCGEPLTEKKVEVLSKQTEPPKRYTEGALIMAMKVAGKQLDDEELIHIMKEVEGLGTEATRANIIDGLKKRGYVDLQKKELVPTDKGRLLIDVLGDSILASPAMTAKWEKRLNEIGQASASAAEFIDQAKKMSIHIVEEAKARVETANPEGYTIEARRFGKKAASRPKASFGVCPSCGKGLVEHPKFIGCSGYREGCKFTMSKQVLGVGIAKDELKQMINGGQSNVHTFKKGDKTFEAALYLEKGALRFEFK